MQKVLTLDERSAILQREIRQFGRSGFRVVSQTDTSVELTNAAVQDPNVFSGIALPLSIFVGSANQRSEQVDVEVDEYGNVKYVYAELDEHGNVKRQKVYVKEEKHIGGNMSELLSAAKK